MRRPVFEVTDPHVETGTQRANAYCDGLDDRCKARVSTAVSGNDERTVVLQTNERRAQAWMPHSTLALPVQRPARPVPRRVHGAQPTDPYPSCNSGLESRPLSATYLSTSSCVHAARGLTLTN